MRIIVLCGAAGAGKSTVARMLVGQHPVKINGTWADARVFDPPGEAYVQAAREHGIRPLSAAGVELALADRLKEIVLDLYDAPPESLWGSSAARSTFLPDWPLPAMTEERPAMTAFLTVRRAAQIIGTEGGRAAHPETWTRYLARRIAELYDRPRVLALQRGGHAVIPPPELCVVPDARFPDEIHALAQGLNHRGVPYAIELWYVRRETDPQPDDAGAWRYHSSERYIAALATMASNTIVNRGSFGDTWSDVRAAFEESP